jgi:hypothetical protein
MQGSELPSPLLKASPLMSSFGFYLRSDVVIQYRRFFDKDIKDALLVPQFYVPKGVAYTVYMQSQGHYFYVFERTSACTALGNMVPLSLACVVGLVCGQSLNPLTLPVAHNRHGAAHHQGLDHPWRSRQGFGTNSVDGSSSGVRHPVHFALLLFCCGFWLQVRQRMVGWHGNPSTLVVDYGGSLLGGEAQGH